MPTIAGMRRRGFSPSALRIFVKKVGVAKRENVIEYDLLETCVRDELKKETFGVMAVLDPLKLVITNYPEDQVEQMEVKNNPKDETMGNRQIPFSNQLLIERKDFKNDPTDKWGLGPGKSVRLRNGYIVTYENHLEDENGNVTEVHVTYNPDTRSGSDNTGIKVKSTIHWVSIAQAIPAEVRMYDKLFTEKEPLSFEDKDFLEFYNQSSLKVVENVFVEPSLLRAKAGARFQFIRNGYFCLDPDSTEGKLVFNSTVDFKSFKKQKK